MILVSPLVVSVWVEKRLWRGELLFTLCSQALALVPGYPGYCLRGAYYLGTLQRCSWETHIGFGSLFTHRDAVVGARVSTGAYCVLGHARIGDDVRMGSRVSIPSGKRQHLDAEGHLAEVTRFDDVSVGAGTWIGEGAILLASVGERCIVSAGAVVTKDTLSRCIIGGNPARVLRSLDETAPTAEVTPATAVS
jgi:acetyltransferase-like isoleucine patch superfamily enzyme